MASNASTLLLVSSYTFDPMNNSWKPSAYAQQYNHRSHHTSSSASSYSYAPAEPTPSIEFDDDEDDIVRHHYSAWGIGDQHGGQESNDNDNGNGNTDPAFVSKSSLVEIQYNKKTGEVSLVDEAGVVTPEEYKRLMKAVKYSHEAEQTDVTGTTASEQQLQSQERQEDVAVGTTLYFDPEDLDPTDIIDTEGQDLPVQELHTEVHTATPAAAHQPEQGQYQHQEQHQGQYQHQHQEQQNHYQQQLQDYPEPSTQYHHSESVSSSETFNSYSIPQPPTELYQHYQYSQQPMQAGHADQYYQQTAPQAQYYQQTATASAVAEYPIPSITDEMEQDLEDDDDDATYRSSRGFGFAHRRGNFGGSDMY